MPNTFFKQTNKQTKTKEKKIIKFLQTNTDSVQIIHLRFEDADLFVTTTSNEYLAVLPYISTAL